MKFSNLIKSIATTVAIGALTMGLAPTSFAATATANMSVNATVNANCIISTNALAFAAYTGAVDNATTTISVTCTNTTPYNVGLDQGKTSGATVLTRQMLNGAATLNYALFSNSGMTTNWGNSTGSWVGGTGSGAAQTLTVYGQIAANQYVTPGSYTDTIIATVNY
ncbi:spore coat U domain-containing protein [Telmatobacter sp. DSM 110680]|uniref:Spore coat U domain-containing protein n=1 Tax=Telmatobacter sp. DSM 110680 TaxID=3036704 RepID=A0AAU7DRV5_9BACT